MPDTYPPRQSSGLAPSLLDVLRQRAKETPGQTAYEFVDPDERKADRLSFQELMEEADLIAAELLRRGLIAHSRALLLYPAGLEFIASFLGCLAAGILPVPAPLSLTPSGTAQIIAATQDSGAAAVLTNSLYLARFRRLLSNAINADELLWIATDEIDADTPSAFQPAPHHADTAFIQYSSGSSGTPKGVVISHAALANNLQMLNHAFNITPADLSISWLPHYHDMGLIAGILHAAYSGITSVLMSPSTFLRRPAMWLSQISTRRATLSGGPNFGYEYCATRVSEEDKKNLDLSSWSVAITGAEPVRAQTIDRFSRAFAACGFRREAFYPCYGLAEATLMVSGGERLSGPKIINCDARALEHKRVVPNSSGDDSRTLSIVGCGTPRVEVSIMDAVHATPVAENQVGEIWAGGGSIGDGYWRRPEQTREAFEVRGQAGVDHRFFRTGDLGFLWQGQLYVTGRLKDLIIIRGRNHAPEDIELTLQLCHPAVSVAAAAAFPLEVEDQERLVVVQEISAVADADVLDKIMQTIRSAIWARHEIDAYQIMLVSAGQVPRTSSGKIRRKECKRAFIEGSLQYTAKWHA